MLIKQFRMDNYVELHKYDQNTGKRVRAGERQVNL